MCQELAASLLSTDTETHTTVTDLRQQNYCSGTVRFKCEKPGKPLQGPMCKKNFCHLWCKNNTSDLQRYLSLFCSPGKISPQVNQLVIFLVFVSHFSRQESCQWLPTHCQSHGGEQVEKKTTAESTARRQWAVVLEAPITCSSKVDIPKPFNT